MVNSNDIERERLNRKLADAERWREGRQSVPTGGESLAAGMQMYRARTQEAAGAKAFISVRLLDAEGQEYGQSFNAYFIFSDSATVANTCLPRVRISKTILVSKIDDIWYVVNPTLIDAGPCNG